MTLLRTFLMTQALPQLAENRCSEDWRALSLGNRDLYGWRAPDSTFRRANEKWMVLVSILLVKQGTYLGEFLADVEAEIDEQTVLIGVLAAIGAEANGHGCAWNLDGPCGLKT